MKNWGISTKTAIISGVVVLALLATTALVILALELKTIGYIIDIQSQKEETSLQQQADEERKALAHRYQVNSVICAGIAAPYVFNFERILNYSEILNDGRLSFWKWLIYPFSSDKHKSLHPLPGKGPFWNWGAFMIPELWFLYQELWGIFFVISGIYVAVIFGAIKGYYNLFQTNVLLIPLLIRLIAGKYGNDIFYTMHGKWPIARWNRKIAPD
jgi:hypothetical protein